MSVWECPESLAWDKAHVVFVVKCILQGALDMIDACLPGLGDNKANEWGGYEKGALESAGEALSIFFAQVSGEGVGCYDALKIAGDFAGAVGQMMESSWADGGVAVTAAMEVESARIGNFRIHEVIPGSPNVEVHAKAFADELLKN
jgi:hypothetical protein